MVSTKRDGFHWKEWLPPKGMGSTIGTSLHWNHWLSVEEMASVKNNGFKKELPPLTVTISEKMNGVVNLNDSH